MGSSRGPSLNKVLTIAFVINSCCIGLNIIAAKRTSTHRTLGSNFKDKHLTSALVKQTHFSPSGQSFEERKHLLESAHEKPSKRFHHFLARTRDIFPIRRSYDKPIRNKEVKNSDLVPVIDHFAGIKTWTVPYNIRDVPRSTTEAIVHERQEEVHTVHKINPKPTPHTDMDKQVVRNSAKEALFDHEYLAYSDVARFAPEVKDTQAGIAEERHSNSKWNGFREPGHSRFNLFAKLNNSKIGDSKDNEQGVRQDYFSFGKFKAVSNSKSFCEVLDLLSFPDVGSFGKFIPDKSKSKDPPVETGKGRVKNRELHHEIEENDKDEVTHSVFDGTYRSKGAFQSIGAFRNDKSDCENIESKSCQTNDDCSCNGLYKCTNGLCTPKSLQPTSTSDSSRDETPREFWHSGPYSKQELGVSY